MYHMKPLFKSLEEAEAAQKEWEAEEDERARKAAEKIQKMRDAYQARLRAQKK